MGLRVGVFVLVLLLWAFPVAADPPVGDKTPVSKVLFDFEGPSEAQAWSNLVLPDAAKSEPPARIELSNEHPASGSRSLRVTFSGGTWPTITTTAVPDDWSLYESFHADVTVSRGCLVGFTVLQERSTRGADWDGLVSRWTKTAFLRPGRNAIEASIRQPNEYAVSPRYGKVLRLELFLYEPRDGESLFVDNIRVSSTKIPKPTPPLLGVFGTDLKVPDVIELNKAWKERWTKPVPKTLSQVYDEFHAAYEKFKTQHPRAMLASFREGEAGFDPKQSDRVFSGWNDAHVNGHGPDSNTEERVRNTGKSPGQELFMRHRSGMFRVDLSSIPQGAEVLAAKLVIVRGTTQYDDGRNPEKDPNLWVAEPCNRPWVENEVNAYEYARGKFWKEISGKFYGDDPDFLPVYYPLGPGQGEVNAWDATDLVRLWTSGRQPNHGFMLHGDPHDWVQRAHYRDSDDVKKRPALLVVYVPK